MKQTPFQRIMKEAEDRKKLTKIRKKYLEELDNILNNKEVHNGR